MDGYFFLILTDIQKRYEDKKGVSVLLQGG